MEPWPLSLIAGSWRGRRRSWINCASPPLLSGQPTSSLECKQGCWVGGRFIITNQRVLTRSGKVDEDVAQEEGFVYNCEPCVTFFCDNCDLWSRTVPDITTHITDGHKLKKGTTTPTLETSSAIKRIWGNYDKEWNMMYSRNSKSIDVWKL